MPWTILYYCSHKNKNFPLKFIFATNIYNFLKKKKLLEMIYENEFITLLTNKQKRKKKTS